MRSLPLLLLALSALPAAAGETRTRGLRYPSLAPGGASVVFAYRGDVWRAPADGDGPAIRLTIHEAQDTLPRVSPDGARVAFSSMRNGGYDVFLVPIEGGVPEQITFHGGAEILCDWSPDGKRILFLSDRDPGGDGLDLYEIEVAGGTARRITRDGAREGSYAPDGESVVYVRGFNTIYQDDYAGSANYDVYVARRDGGAPRRLTDTPGNERYPFFSADGSRIYFVAEEGGVAGWYSMPAAGGERRRIFAGAADVHRPDVSWDHRTAVYESAGRLHVLDLAAPESARELPLEVKSDVRSSGFEMRTITSGGEHVDVAPDGSRVVFSVRGDLWTMPAGGGNAVRLTSGPSNDQWPRFSPDGTRIAYFSDAKGNEDIYVLDLRTGRSERVTTHEKDDFFHDWSPDGKRIVYSSERSGQRDLWVRDLESGTDRQLTRDEAADDDPVFSPDGALIAFDSGRGGQQAIYVVRADGSGLRRVSQGAGFFQVPSFSPDGSMVVFEEFDPVTGGSGGLYVVPVTGGEAMQISRDGSGASWSPRGDWIYFAAERDGEQGIYRVPAPEAVEAGERVPFVGRVQVDRRAELANVFDEAWARLRDGFYDEKMHGVDWNVMKEKYRARAIDAENRDEFHNVVREMLAELNASHLGIWAAPEEGSPSAPQTGYLGLDLEDAAEGRKVVSVTPDGPADAAGLRAGDMLVSVDGTKLEPRTNLAKVLSGTVGKEIAVAFRPIREGGLGEERTAKLTPVARGKLAEAEYRRWVRGNAERVKEATGGRAGYVHLNRMDAQNLRRFQQAVARWNADGKVEGMVLDVRNNGGGNIHGELMRILMAKPLALVQRRGGPRIPEPQLHWGKPVVLLINERSFSDAEVFPYMFRQARVGKIVGVPTAGGVIGTNDVTLSDGSRFRIPRTGFYGVDGKNLEGYGVPPDVLVEETPEDRFAGRDPQLEKAVEILRGELEAAAPEGPPEEAEPAPQPAPALAASAMDPLADVRPGEWVRYRVPARGGEQGGVVRISVSRVEEDAVVFAREVEGGSAGFVESLPERLPRAPALECLSAFGEVVGHELAVRDVGGVRAEVLTATVRRADGSRVALHVTNRVPCYGLWKMEADGEILLEAAGWSEAEERDEPPHADTDGANR